MILLLTIFFLCLGAAASFGPPRWFVEKSSRHQIRTLFLLCLALLPGGHAAKQQSAGKEAAALSVSNATAMAPRADPQSWEELTRASASNGTIHLSADFEMGNYTEAIDFGGKVLVIWGNNATLDAAGKGRFFTTSDGGNGIKTSLELHGLVMQSGTADEVSFLPQLFQN